MMIPFIQKKLKLFWSYLQYLSFTKKQIPEDSRSENNALQNAEMLKLSIKELFELAWQNDSSFYHQFRQSFPDFDNKLLEINPSIKISDIEFCALIKLNFNTKQIATIKKMTVGAVEAKKYRIRKKLNISSTENIYIMISKI